MDKMKKPRKKANGYKMPDPIPQGEILTDIAKKQWRLGTSIGKGGFGEIYSACEASSKASKYPFVIKVEPHENGPLFVEMHFYMKNAKQADIEAFMKKNKLKSLGMPAYLGSGSHEIGSTKYRFIVMERFGTDIDKLRKENKGALSTNTTFQLAWQITYVLEYIHEFGYVHADIKGGNILMGTTPATKNQAYLLDFGLATKLKTDKEFKPNPKKAHDGTIEYLSRDAHSGVPTRRGDFEILGYNIIHWLGGALPWERAIDDPNVVQQMKENSLADIPKFVKSCLKKNNETLVKFLQYVNTLKFNEAPDYTKIRALFEAEIKKNGATAGSVEISSPKRRNVQEAATAEDSDNELTKPFTKRQKKKHVDQNGDLPSESKDFTSPKKRRVQEAAKAEEDGELVNPSKKKETKLKKKIYVNQNGELPSGSKVFTSPKKRGVEEPKDEPSKKRGKKKGEQQQVDETKEEMTEAMKNVLKKRKEKEADKKKKPATKKGETNEDEANSTSKSTQKTEERPARLRRQLPAVNYDESEPKTRKRK